MKRTLALSALALLLTLGTANAQTITAAPTTMNFQGRLAKKAGTPIADGTHTVTFRIYDAQTGGNVKWAEQIGSLTTKNGAFSAILGKVFPFTDTILNGTVWLEIQVDSDPALNPRQQFQSVAYALKANTVPDGAITNAKIADGAITAAKLASGVAFSLPYTGSSDSSDSVFKITNTNGTGSGVSIYGENLAGGVGVYGFSTHTTGVLAGTRDGIALYAIGGNYAGYFSGNVFVTGTITNPSDARYKTNIVTMNNALDNVLSLRGVTYSYKPNDFESMNFPKGKQVGLIAQEIEKVLPVLVHTDKNGYKSVNYIGVIPVLVEAIKAQEKKIDALEKQNARIADLEAQLAALTTALREMKTAQEKAKTTTK